MKKKGYRFETLALHAGQEPDPATLSRAVPIYRTLPVAPGDEPADAVVFASASAVDGWFLTRDTGGMVVAAIGRPTADALELHDVIADAVPNVPGFGTMASALREVIT